MGTTYTARQVMSLIVIAVVVAGGVGYFIGRSSPGGSKSPVTADETSALNLANSPGSSEGTASPSPSLSGKNSIVVRDQPSGNEVKIESVVLQQPAWIAIHEDRNGKPGNILGARLYPVGTTSAGTAVELLRPTVRGVYYAMLHIDDGDRKFNYAKDAPLTENGAPVMVRFLVGETSGEL